MNISKNIIIGSILVGAGIHKTYADYKKAPENHKTRTLIRNTAILGTAATTVFYSNHLMNKTFNKRLQNYILHLNEKFPKLKFLQEIDLSKYADISFNCLKDLVTAMLATTSGIIGGLITDKILDKTKFSPKDTINIKYKTLDQTVDKIIHNPIINKASTIKNNNAITQTARFFNAAGFISNPFDMPNTILNSYEMAKDKNIKKIAEKTSIGIIANTFIPTLFLAIANNIMKNKNIYLKLPVLAASFYLGDILGTKASNKMKKQLNFK